ncbi:hypothetical protein GN244_ATG10561 [Phytophthora infestans]|uniref:Uncharacterized protein n=1 Tax=Phytophthora infestans TaxID=4787 RepID=A0A833SSQ1_PHYIN|nr:hypothetical protein GN244_ATG10561 [Phytophthora infestans]
MRCHRGFWVYAAEHGEDVVSGNAARFAREQVAQELPGVNKAAENWLRSRAGRALRARWLGQSPAERLRYITDNPDASFPLADNPSGIADLRRDRSRYPTMVRLPVSTPKNLLGAGPTAAALDTPPLDEQTQEQVEAFEGYCGDLMRAATTAELTALAYAHRQSNVDRVVDSSVALVECMGIQMAASIPDTYRQRILKITREVARQLRATKTQMTVSLHTDTECQAAISEARESVNAADNVLRSFVQDYVGVNPTFAAMPSSRDYYRPVGTKLLTNFYWLGGANCTDSAVVSLSRVDEAPARFMTIPL